MIEDSRASLHLHGGPQSLKPMRLAEFILTYRAEILAEWEEFAKSCSPASGTMSIVALSDHASEMLTVIAEDLKTPQDSVEQSEKSKGHAPIPAGNARTAAEKHGTGRAESGFTMDQMVAEYRALRASVIRLWSRGRGAATEADLVDLTRFNEAIDQSLAESITRFTQDLDKSKEMFLAILGHDLRTPIGAVMTSARFMLETNELPEPHQTLTSRIVSASTRMNHMVGALLDFTRSRLGGGIPVARTQINMGKVVHDVVDEISAAHPGRIIKVDARGSLTGRWDCQRITQVLSNLIVNALEHGGDRSVVNVIVHGEATEVSVAIHNRGPSIPGDDLDGIFNAMKRRSPDAKTLGPSANLGLGLFIADQIVQAHKGTIQVESSDERGTTFTVHLPRNG
jgi:signal transduction histidine kinase